MNKKTSVKLIVSFSITFSLAAAILLSSKAKTYRILELKGLDVLFTLQGNRPASCPVVHIDIDDASLSKVGRWPWPRSYHAGLTSILRECGAKQILWDVIFTEADKKNPQDDESFTGEIARSGNTYLAFYYNEPQPFPFPRLKKILSADFTISAKTAAVKLGADPEAVGDALPQAKRALLDDVCGEYVRGDPDISFEEILEKIETDHGWFLFAEDESFLHDSFSRHKLIEFFLGKFSVNIPHDKWIFKDISGALNVPAMAYSAAAAGSGFINADPDIDGVTRKVPLFVRYRDRILPQLTIAALLDRLDVRGVEIGKNKVTLKNARFHPGIKDIVIPVDNQGMMIINWTGLWGRTFKHVPYYLILQLKEVREELAAQERSAAADFLKKQEKALFSRLASIVKGKICVVGLTATGTHDLRPIPLQENYPMVGTHSNIISTILNERFIVKKEGFLKILIFFLTAFVIALGSVFKPWKSLLISLGFAAIYFGAVFLLFTRYGIWIDSAGPAGIVVFGFAGIMCYRFFTEEKEKLWIKKAFSHYLSGEVITEMMEDPSRLKLGGERRSITVMFSDVRGFTRFSESRQPEEVVAMLNEVLSLQVNVIFKYNGTLDKFVGDEVMAFFGAPSDRHKNDHALVAVKTALEIQERMDELRAKMSDSQKEAVQIGIGINTGDMVVGNMGSSQRMDYTVIGDNVNLGARLCSAAGHGEIIVSESTYLMVADFVTAEKLEPITVKGKTKPVSIYRITGLKKI